MGAPPSRRLSGGRPARQVEGETPSRQPAKMPTLPKTPSAPNLACGGGGSAIHHMHRAVGKDAGGVARKWNEANCGTRTLESHSASGCMSGSRRASEFGKCMPIRWDFADRAPNFLKTSGRAIATRRAGSRRLSLAPDFQLSVQAFTE